MPYCHHELSYSSKILLVKIVLTNGLSVDNDTHGATNSCPQPVQGLQVLFASLQRGSTFLILLCLQDEGGEGERGTHNSTYFPTQRVITSN